MDNWVQGWRLPVVLSMSDRTLHKQSSCGVMVARGDDALATGPSVRDSARDWVVGREKTIMGAVDADGGATASVDVMPGQANVVPKQASEPSPENESNEVAVEIQPETEDERALVAAVGQATRRSLCSNEWKRRTLVTAKVKETVRRRSSAAFWMDAIPSNPQAIFEENEGASDDRVDGYHPDAHRANRITKFVNTIVLPILVCYVLAVWYAAAIFFRPDARSKSLWDKLLWTPGVLVTDVNGTDSVCPKPTLCSDGWGEIVLLMISRLTAFVIYVTIFLVYLTKCHSLTYFLSRTYVAELIPFEYLHTTHKAQGIAFFALALMHTIGHLIRWGLRSELSTMMPQTVSVSGITAMVLLVMIVTPMLLQRLKARLSFELRIELHAGRAVEVLLVLCMLLHAKRAGLISLICIGLWGADKVHMLLFRTHRLEVVELTHIDDGDASKKSSDSVGVQMLWRNPKGFEPKSGEYVQVQFPWLSSGGYEWHPFSLYLRDARAAGCFAAARDSEYPLSASLSHGGRWSSKAGGYVRGSVTSRQESGVSVTSSASIGSQASSASEALRAVIEELDPSMMDVEAREEATSYDTTQVFMMPAGDWTKRLSESIKDRRLRRHRTVWIRGPFVSPFASASDFSQLVLFASGIGITPSLGILGQYRGAKRIKFLIWCTRSAAMLKFFAPLLADAHVATCYYTGKQKLTEEDIAAIKVHGNINIHQRRPRLVECFARTILAFESVARGLTNVSKMDDVDASLRASWCGLYCGGSLAIENQLGRAAKKWGVGWQVERFDW